MDLIRKYFPNLSSQQIEQFVALDSIYREWNEKINVISRKDIDQLYERHVLHSLAIAKIIQFANGTKVLDVGTGGGFPGVPLAIYFPDVHFHLIDSIGKKIRVVNEVISALQLKNVTAEQLRLDSPQGKIEPQYDFSVSRAVAPLKEMTEWIKQHIQKGNNSSLPNGMIFLKGGDLKQEILETKRSVKIFSISDYFSEDFFAEKKIVYLPV